MTVSLCSAYFSLFLLLADVSGKFLSGTVSVMTVSPPTYTTIRVTYRLSWEKGTGPCGKGCSEKNLGSLGNISDFDTRSLQWIIYCDNSSQTVGNINYIVTSVSINNTSGWEQGEQWFEVPNQATVYMFELSGIPWVSSLNQTSTGTLLARFKMQQRFGTSRPNFSPYSSVPPYIGVPIDCKSTVFIPAEDPEGDRILCRWALPDECKGACTNVPNDTVWLDEEKCTLNITAIHTYGYRVDTMYRLTLMVEDFPDRIGEKVEPMSSVSIQFSLRVINIAGLCPQDYTAHFVTPTARNMAHMSISLNTFKQQIPIQTSFYLQKPNIDYAEFMFSGPRHIIYHYSPDDLDITFNRTNVLLADTTWIPAINQYGNQQLCAWVVDARGWTSSNPRCITVIAPDDNHCQPSTCQHNETCINLYEVDKERCLCTSRYKGQNCSETVTCTDQPCEHNGTCAVDVISGYVCSCAPGYSGIRCNVKIAPCSSEPCRNNGVCLNVGALYKCVCPPRYTGRQCELFSYCDDASCDNNGTCVEMTSSYHCFCRQDYYGERCQTPIQPCLSKPCLNQGACVPAGTSYSCVCPSNYTGILCEVHAYAEQSSELNQASPDCSCKVWCILAVSMGVAFIMAIVIIIYLSWKIKQAYLTRTCNKVAAAQSSATFTSRPTNDLKMV